MRHESTRKREELQCQYAYRSYGRVPPSPRTIFFYAFGTLFDMLGNHDANPSWEGMEARLLVCILNDVNGGRPRLRRFENMKHAGHPSKDRISSFHERTNDAEGEYCAYFKLP
jgi:hypothetical protein